VVEHQTDPTVICKLLDHYIKIAKERGATLQLVMVEDKAKDLAEGICMIIPFDAAVAVRLLTERKGACAKPS
jgi:hypothetical protein